MDSLERLIELTKPRFVDRILGGKYNIRIFSDKDFSELISRAVKENPSFFNLHPKSMKNVLGDMYGENKVEEVYYRLLVAFFAYTYQKEEDLAKNIVEIINEYPSVKVDVLTENMSFVVRSILYNENLNALLSEYLENLKNYVRKHYVRKLRKNRGGGS